MFRLLLIPSALALLAAGCPTEPGPGDTGPAETGGVTAATWSGEVHPLLDARCRSCHQSITMPMPLVGDPHVDYPSVHAYVNVHDPDGSPVVTAPTGTEHPQILPSGGVEVETLLAWIRAGALED